MAQFAGIVLVRAESKSDDAVPTQDEKVADETTEEQEKTNEEGPKSKTVEEMAAQENGESQRGSV